MKHYELIRQEERLTTPRMRVVSVHYEGEDGSTIKHTIVRSNPSVCVIVMDEDANIALIKQFRSTTGRWYWELPAGVANDGENILETAKREVEEETGIVTSSIRLVTNCSNLLDPSKSDEDFGVAIATFEGKTARHLDDQEAIDGDITWMPIDEAIARIRTQMQHGDFKDGMEMSGHSLYALLSFHFMFLLDN